MLSRRNHSNPTPRTQQGMVLLMAIVALVALTLGALALTRSVYTSNVIAGNLAFQRSATHSAEAGLEAAFQWLETQKAVISDKGGMKLHHADDQAGYSPKRMADDRSVTSWVEYWNTHLEPINPVELNATLAGTAQTDNEVSYAIERMCTNAGDPTATNNACTVSPRPAPGTCNGGSSCSGGEQNLDSSPPVYYRITVLVRGPRNARSLVQAMVAL